MESVAKGGKQEAEVAFLRGGRGIRVTAPLHLFGGGSDDDCGCRTTGQGRGIAALLALSAVVLACLLRARRHRP